MRGISRLHVASRIFVSYFSRGIARFDEWSAISRWHLNEHRRQRTGTRKAQTNGWRTERGEKESAKMSGDRSFYAVVKFERNRIIRESGNRLTILTKNFDNGNKNGIEFFPFFNFLSVWFIYWILLLSILSSLYYYSFILFTLLFIYYFVSIIAKNRTELNNERICLIMLRLHGFL